MTRATWYLIAIAALVLVGGGSAVAAKRYLITSSKQIKPGSISESRLSKGARASLKGKTGPTGPAGAAGAKGDAGAKGETGAPGPTASGYAKGQNEATFVNSSADVTAVQLTGTGGTGLLSTAFAARLHIDGVVRLRNNTGSGNRDQSGCRPQVSSNGGAFSDAGPEMLGLTNGDNTINDEASIPITGAITIVAGSYDVRIVCKRVASSGTANQNKFNGNALSVIAVAS